MGALRSSIVGAAVGTVAAAAIYVTVAGPPQPRARTTSATSVLPAATRAAPQGSPSAHPGPTAELTEAPETSQPSEPATSKDRPAARRGAATDPEPRVNPRKPAGHRVAARPARTDRVQRSDHEDDADHEDEHEADHEAHHEDEHEDDHEDEDERTGDREHDDD